MDAYREIENLIYRYAERMDAGDLEGVAELFRHADIVAPAHDSRVGGYENVLAMYRAACRVYPETGTPRTSHVTTNVLIEVEGEKAVARSIFTVFQATEALPLQPIIMGRYNDEFFCSKAKWQFHQRSIQVDFVGDCSAHLLYDASTVS